LDSGYIWLEPLTDEREIYEDSESPSDETDHDSSTDECPKSSRYSGYKIGPEHLPGRPDILHEFFESDRFDRIYESFDLFSF
jgi:hypothetical protein